MKKNRIFALLLAILMMAAGAMAETADDPVVVKVGDKVKLLSEVQDYFDYLYSEYSSYYMYYLGAELSSEDIGYILDEAIDTFAYNAVLDNKVEEYGLGEITDEDKAQLQAEAQTMMDEAIASYIDYYGGTEEEAVAFFADNYGITVDVLYESALGNLSYNRLYDYCVADVEVSDEDVLAEYNTYVESDKTNYGEDAGMYEYYTIYYGSEIYYVPEGFRLVKHILLETPEDITAELLLIESKMDVLQDEIYTLSEELYALENVEDGAEEPRSAEEIQADIDSKEAEFVTLEQDYQAMKETILPALQGTIDDISARLSAGEAFDALIAEYNTDPGMESNPDGYKVHADSVIWEETFRNTSIALQNVGDVSEPILTEFGVHIIQYAGDVEGGPVPISSEISETLRESLLSTARDNAFNTLVEQWMEELAVETYPELISLPAVGETTDDALVENTEDGTEDVPEEVPETVG